MPLGRRSEKTRHPATHPLMLYIHSTNSRCESNLGGYLDCLSRIRFQHLRVAGAELPLAEETGSSLTSFRSFSVSATEESSLLVSARSRLSSEGLTEEKRVFFSPIFSLPLCGYRSVQFTRRRRGPHCVSRSLLLWKCRISRRVHLQTPGGRQA